MAEKTREEAEQEAMREFEKLRAAGGFFIPGQKHGALVMRPRILNSPVAAALVIRFERTYLAAFKPDRATKHFTEDLKEASVFLETSNAVRVCDGIGGPGWQVVANPGTNVEEVIYENDKVTSVTPHQYADFIREYFREGAYPDERVGQAFINHVLALHDPELFQEKNQKTALNMITSRYVEI